MAHFLAITVVVPLFLVGVLNIISAWRMMMRNDADAVLCFYGGLFLLVCAWLVAWLGGL